MVVVRVEGSFNFVTRQSRQRHPVGMGATRLPVRVDWPEPGPARLEQLTLPRHLEPVSSKAFTFRRGGDLVIFGMVLPVV
jgi:hypothetical protein